jgi:hypothetical protein
VEIARRPNFKGLHASQEVNYKLYDTFLVLYFYFETSASEILLIHVQMAVSRLLKHLVGARLYL